MGKRRTVLAALAACVLILALGVAPLFSALTHGPGQLALKADHTAPVPHAGTGDHWHPVDHDHHAAADHDHATTVILPPVGDLRPPATAEDWTAQAHPLAGTIRDGPRRPPRHT